MLDIYLRHCFKIVFEIFHVMGRWPLFQINYIDIDFETPNRSMWWIDGDGVAQRILNVPIGGDLT